MKAISLKQPWASFVAMGKKTIETRTWHTYYRGDLLIVSSKTIDKNHPMANFLSLGLRFGQALAIAKLTGCRIMKKADEEAAMCPWRPYLFAWILEDIRTIDPFPVKGQLGLYDVDFEENREREMSKPKEMKTRCCGAEVKVYLPVIPLGPEASPPDPIEYCDDCGRRVQLEDIIFVEEDEE